MFQYARIIIKKVKRNETCTHNYGSVCKISLAWSKVTRVYNYSRKLFVLENENLGGGKFSLRSSLKPPASNQALHVNIKSI